MHAKALEFVARHATDAKVSVVEIGSRQINGGVRHLFPNADYWGIDIVPGLGVDEVADGASWRPIFPVDVVVCCEVFEHTPQWPLIVSNAAKMLRKGGKAVFTMAGPGRPEHGIGHDFGDGYENITPAILGTVLGACFTAYDLELTGTDLRAVAVR